MNPIDQEITDFINCVHTDFYVKLRSFGKCRYIDTIDQTLTEILGLAELTTLEKLNNSKKASVVSARTLFLIATKRISESNDTDLINRALECLYELEIGKLVFLEIPKSMYDLCHRNDIQINEYLDAVIKEKGEKF